jgi:hypothetical protein
MRSLVLIFIFSLFLSSCVTGVWRHDCVSSFQAETYEDECRMMISIKSGVHDPPDWVVENCMRSRGWYKEWERKR